MSLVDKVKPLDGWVTLPDVGDTLGLTKQAVHKLLERKLDNNAKMRRSGRPELADFDEDALRRVGSVVILKESEVKILADKRAARFRQADEILGDIR